jgi:hypothetical protein
MRRTTTGDKARKRASRPVRAATTSVRAVSLDDDADVAAMGAAEARK